MQNLATPGSPRFPKIHKFCVLSGFWQFLEKIKFQKKIILSNACEIYPRRVALDSQKMHKFCVLLGFWQFLEKNKISKKNLFFVARVQNLPTPGSPRFSKNT